MTKPFGMREVTPGSGSRCATAPPPRTAPGPAERDVGPPHLGPGPRPGHLRRPAVGYRLAGPAGSAAGG
ncbi:MAG: hypothetical protein ACRDRJ_13715 [Streptosporangiaceae bacterium]